MSYVATVTVPTGTVASTLTDFITRVNLADMPAGWWADVASDGSNVRVRSGGVDIPFDLVKIDTATSTGELFFKATLTTGSNVFTVEVVSGATAPAATDPIGRNAVWSDYNVVLIFAGGLVNRTGKTADATLGGLASITAAGLLHVPNDGYAIISDSGTRLAAYTMAISAIPDELNGHDAMLSYGSSAASTDRSTLAYRNIATWALWNSSNSWLDSGVSPVHDQRYRLAATHSAADGRKIYADGSLIASGACSAIPASANSFLVGSSQTNNTEDFNGHLTYAYLRSGILSANWIAAERKSWETTTFYTVTDSGTPSTTGTLAFDAPTPVVVLSGTYTPPEITGTLALDAPAPDVALTGGSAAAEITGTLAVDAPPPAVALAGTYAHPVVTGTLSLDTPIPELALTGEPLGAPINATLTLTAPAPFTYLTGRVALVDTDLTYSSDGYGYDMLARVDHVPPIVESPAVQRTKVKRVHQSLPPPTLVDGRPT